MFGIKMKINDDSLYMINDIVENQLLKNKIELSGMPALEMERRKFLTAQTAYFESELKKFKEEIESQLAEKFQFSTEELYAMYGQYDNKYIAVEFHKFSQSALKFGRDISGVFVYTKKEREALETCISQGSGVRTKGVVKIDCSLHEALSNEQKHDLMTNGFVSGDIYQILASDLPSPKTYNQQGTKEIPNTINIKFDPSGFDSNASYLWICNQKIKKGHLLIEEEWAKFCGLSLYFEPESIKKDLITKHAFDENGIKKQQVRFHELAAKLHAADINGEETSEFKELLKIRNTQRTQFIKNEIKRSTNKKLEHFEAEYPEIYKELQKSIAEFETESLEYFDMTTPVYWDYEGYLHIYLRHCDKLGIEGHFENKTKFQYARQDIRRILKIAVKKLKNDINERLKAGKEYRINGDRLLYFNGNYYSMHVLSNGRVAAFHPMENPEN